MNNQWQLTNLGALVGPFGRAQGIYNLGQITIGARATISHRAHLCGGTHDYTKADFPLLRAPISIGEPHWGLQDRPSAPLLARG